MAERSDGLAMTASCVLHDDATLERRAMFLSNGPRNTVLAEVVIVTDLEGNVIEERLEISDAGRQYEVPLDRERLLKAGRQVLSYLPFIGPPRPSP